MLRSTRVIRFVFAIAVAAFSTIAVRANAAILKGTVNTKMVTIKALQPTGSPDPSKDPACKSKYGNLIGKVATTTYEINTTTLMMSAATTFQGQTHKLNALGVAHSYSFGRFYNPPRAPLNMYAALFSLDKQGKNPVNTFVLVLSAQTNCAVSSAVGMW